MQNPEMSQMQSGPIYSVDVECVATGADHNARAVGQIALVDQYERPVLNIYVRPEKEVVSYLTPLNGLTKELLDKYGVPFADAVAALKHHLPKNSTLVGQNIGADVQWVGIQEGVDFAGMIDLAGIYRTWNAQYNSWSVFGQDHLAKCLLGIDASHEAHNALTDAAKSIRLFNLYQMRLRVDPQELARAQQLLISTPVEPSFAKKNPSFEGCCMGNRKTCTCGGAFFG